MAFAAIFITPLTILVAESSSPGPVSSALLMQTRLINTVVGALIGSSEQFVCTIAMFDVSLKGAWLRSNLAEHEGSVDGNRLPLRLAIPGFLVEIEVTAIRP